MTHTDTMTPSSAGGSGGLVDRAVGLYGQIATMGDKVLFPVLQLGIRVYMGWEFLKVGLLRLERWDSQAFLFDDIHPIPGVPGEVSAPLATAGELLLPILLIAGLFGRLGALGLLVMTMVIQYIVAQTPQGMENGIGNDVHYLWMFLFLVIALKGPGVLSVDHALGRWWKGRNAG